MDLSSRSRQLKGFYGRFLHGDFLPEDIFRDMRGNRLATPWKTGFFEG